jgi:hypothetical protein
VKPPPTVAAAVLLLAVNGWVLLGVARNRLGDPDATLTLSERELVIRRSTELENSSVEAVLQVNQWQPGMSYERRYEWAAWLPPQRMAELGFDLAMPTDLKEAHRLARRQSARRGWAVIQLGGDRWDPWAGAIQAAAAELDRKISAEPKEPWLKEQRRQLEHELRAGTRLFMIDAGADAAVLRAAYPDRAAVLILPAEIHFDLSVDKDATVCVPQRCRPVGRVSLLTGELQVPRHLQALLPPEPPPSQVARDDDLHRPHFTAVVRSGARREAWLESVQP